MARQLTALVIGSAAYRHADKLRNPANDAEDVSTALNSLGFSTIKLIDASTEDMDRALQSFGEQLKNSDVGLFFFAGHAFQIDGHNFLAGIDTKADTKMNIQYSALHLDKVIGTMKEAAVPSSIIILDACRNNPFDLILHRSGASPELAPINAPKGTLIAFSTSPGQRSQDGSNRNGSYTEALLQHITTEDISIETMFKRVRSTLETLTAGTQVSWEHTSLTGDFRFRLRADAPVNGYRRTALADSLFALRNKQPAHQLIRELKSYSWYTQNPALRAFGVDEAELATRDDLFVVGRNVYQAACGNSNEAQNYIQNFLSRTEGLDEGKRKALLDGMLFEVFFDSEGQFRRRPKMAYFAELFQLQQFPELADSFEFLRANLRPYAEHFYVIPGGNAEVSIDVAGDSLLKDSVYTVTALWYEGANILHEGRDDAFNSRFNRKFTPEEFRDFLSTEMIVPKHSLNVKYPSEHTEYVIIPEDLTVSKGA